MAKIVSITNHKGGVGKTTTSLNLGAALASLGKHTLLIDLDPQANLTQCLGLFEPEKTVGGALEGNYPLPIYQAEERLDIVPASLELAATEDALKNEEEPEYLLRTMIRKHTPSYDFILIDTPPSLGLLTVNSFAAAHTLLIPLQAQFLSFQGLNSLKQVIERAQKTLNKKLRLGGVIITQYDKRKTLNRNVFELAKEQFGNAVLETKIRDNVALAEAPVAGQSIFQYAPKSRGAEDYMSLATELLEKEL